MRVSFRCLMSGKEKAIKKDDHKKAESKHPQGEAITTPFPQRQDPSRGYLACDSSRRENTYKKETDMNSIPLPSHANSQTSFLLRCQMPMLP